MPRARLNPHEWCERVPEVVPLGMDHSPYPDRIVTKPGFERDLAKRTLTNLYNQRPAWLAQAHDTLDKAVAAAYGWADWTPAMAATRSCGDCWRSTWSARPRQTGSGR